MTPSAQHGEQYSFNLNDYVYVKMSQKGIDWLHKNNESFRLRPGSINRIGDDGWCRYQMHDLIATFGAMFPAMCYGNQTNPFVGMEFRFNKADLHEIQERTAEG